ncbi:hypothetical protein EYZ11_002318 [Aspergillus tanneri]|uniref:Uncharacterized protein n=1 Tax=Aspergillus tanneri TaxID=1220188 RepID=A0A4S3JRB1_9EURO|nr:hypothetical protein EYZ11_002318 [Aspergillus tanneri]
MSDCGPLKDGPVPIHSDYTMAINNSRVIRVLTSQGSAQLSSHPYMPVQKESELPDPVEPPPPGPGECIMQEVRIYQ